MASNERIVQIDVRKIKARCGFEACRREHPQRRDFLALLVLKLFEQEK